MIKTKTFVGAFGFTLIEMLAVLAVMAILLGLGSAGISRFLDATRLRTLSNDLLRDLQLARSEAILRGQRVVLCAANASEDCSSVDGWHQGWLMFEDVNNNGLREATELAIRFRPAAPHGWQIAGNNPVARYVSYDSLGQTRLMAGGFQAGTITVCKTGSSGSSAVARQVVVNSVGRPRGQDAVIERCG